MGRVPRVPREGSSVTRPPVNPPKPPPGRGGSSPKPATRVVIVTEEKN